MPSKLVADIGDVPDIHEGGALPAQPVILAMGGSATIGARLLPAGRAGSHHMLRHACGLQARQRRPGHPRDPSLPRASQHSEHDALYRVGAAAVQKDFCSDGASNRHEHPRSTDSNHRSRRSHHNHRRSPYTHLPAAMAAATRRTPASATTACMPPTSMPATAPMAGSKLHTRKPGIFFVEDVEG